MEMDVYVQRGCDPCPYTRQTPRTLDPGIEGTSIGHLAFNLI